MWLMCLMESYLTGGYHCGISYLSVLLLVALCNLCPMSVSALNCHSDCICASNIVSCSKKELVNIPNSLPEYTAVLDLSYNSLARLRAQWTKVRLSRLHTLLLSHNGLFFTSEEAFTEVPHLKYLDLSSNKLKALEELHFQGLEELEVLLLYNNQISQIDRTAFEGLDMLKKLYLSQNLITRFPQELVNDNTRLSGLELLDVSSNKIKSLPVQELNDLPAYLKNSLYIHNNPLVCHCSLYLMVTQWHARQFNSAVDFRNEFKCILPLNHKVSIKLFELQEDYMNCSTIIDSEVEAFLEGTLTFHCDTRLRNMTKVWVTPDNETIQAGRNNQSLKMFRDGSLWLGNLRLEDSGTYTCLATSSQFNETIHVQLRVHNSTASPTNESLNTAYTTLVGCVASVILVLIYLYLTPCHCCCRSKAEMQKSQQEDSIHSSILSATSTHDLSGDKAAMDRRVAFIEPTKDMQGQNGKLKPNAVEEFEDKRLLTVPRKKSDCGSIGSVSSNSPIVV
ncbi:amphoterin-induced protein 1 [Scyliorhinus canicula]|uniref:amphoterin-induced protein 1 n=1 Tax=Scyliorhinus canicula TaxID=7830 RepID=UPI0018F572F6|nr:amphoterin-induced protein 1 [Scyliorhinus canicula]